MRRSTLQERDGEVEPPVMFTSFKDIPPKKRSKPRVGAYGPTERENATLNELARNAQRLKARLGRTKSTRGI